MSAPRLGLDDLAALEEQRRFLLRSLEDLDLERDAGDLDDVDYETLHADYTHRAAEVLRAIDEQHELIEQDRPDRPLARKVIAVLAVVVVAVVAGLVVAATSGEHGPQQAAGGLDLTPSAEVTKCIDLMQTAFRPAAQGTGNANFASDALSTIKCFSARIDAHPDDAVAYTYRGWSMALLARQIDGAASPVDVQSFVQRSMQDLAKARSLAPRYPDALTFSAIASLWTQDVKSAEAYLAEIDALPLPANAPILGEVNQLLRPALTAARAQSTSSTPATTTSTVAPGPSTP